MVDPGVYMIKSNLSLLMGRDKLRIADVARVTGLNRSTITKLYHETATRIEIESLHKLCALFKCQPNDLFVYEQNKKLESDIEALLKAKPERKSNQTK